MDPNVLRECAQSLLESADLIRKVRANRIAVTDCNDCNVYDSVVDVRDVSTTAK